MICKEIWRAEVIVEHQKDLSQDAIKDKAWALFDEKSGNSLEQENYTKIEKFGT